MIKYLVLRHVKVMCSYKAYTIRKLVISNKP